MRAARCAPGVTPIAIDCGGSGLYRAAMSISDLKMIKLALLCACLAPGCVVADGDSDDDDAGTDGTSASQSGSASNSGQGSGPSSDSSPSSDSGPESDSDSDSSSDSTPGSDSDSDSTPGSDSDSDPTTDSDSDSDSDPTTDSDSDSSSDTDSDSDGSSSTGNDTDSGSDTNADDPLQEWAWTYSETGSSVDCGSAPAPTNGFGNFLVQNSDATGFTIVPSDGTDPFDCDLDSGAYDCPDRLVETSGQAGTNVQLNAFVRVVGDVVSSSSVTGVQEGRLECEGTDCGTAELLLGTTFPCTFDIDFAATHD